jgi:hypothetical protein
MAGAIERDVVPMVMLRLYFDRERSLREVGVGGNYEAHGVATWVTELKVDAAV